MNSRGPRKSSSECPRLKWENDGGSPVEAHRSSIHKNVPFVTCTGGDRSYTFVCNSLSLCMPFYSYPACDRWDRALILSQPLWFLSQGGVFQFRVGHTRPKRLERGEYTRQKNGNDGPRATQDFRVHS
jgi:hypothetical protein